MDGYKTDDSRLIAIFKSSRDSWKTKCVSKQKRIKALSVKLRDTASSRAEWKHKTKVIQTQLAAQNALLQAQQAEIQLLKKNLNHLNLQLESNPK
jgi:chromosome segregation ATPase